MSSSITGSAVYRAGGGAGTADGADDGTAGQGTGTNTGGGEDGAPSTSGGDDGVVILRFPSYYTISIGAGLTSTSATVSTDTVVTFTAGTGSVSFPA